MGSLLPAICLPRNSKIILSNLSIKVYATIVFDSCTTFCNEVALDVMNGEPPSQDSSCRRPTRLLLDLQLAGILTTSSSKIFNKRTTWRSGVEKHLHEANQQSTSKKVKPSPLR